jgi:hypothetical protein
MLLVRVVGVLTCGIFIINVALYKPVLSVLLFSLAIAVGITPQLLPAVNPTLTPFPADGVRQTGRPKAVRRAILTGTPTPAGATTSGPCGPGLSALVALIGAMQRQYCLRGDRGSWTERSAGETRCAGRKG